MKSTGVGEREALVLLWCDVFVRRYTCRGRDNIKVYLTEVEFGYMDWVKTYSRSAHK